MGDIVPRKTLVRRGSWGLGGVVGGIAVFLLGTIVASLPAIGPIAGTLLRLSGIGLLGTGIVNLIRFVRGVRSRS